tara:strand:+ start:2805 stop:3896 length:1092 start_codon:yes stop_codon:yes gene_type:complete
MNSKIVVFMPSIEGGGVEKNLFLVCNYLVKKVKNLKIITISKKFRKRFDRPVEFITYRFGLFDHLGRRIKYLLSIFLLIKEILKNRDIVVFSFQANLYCIIICKLFSVKVISRSNSAPIGWSRNFIKRLIFKMILNLSDEVLVNSYQFKNDLKKEFNITAQTIYNPLNRKEIIEKSKKKSKKIFNSKKKLRILNIGRFTDQKDQMTLLKSLNIIKNKIDFEASIVGRGNLKIKLQNYIEKKNLQESVKLYNFVENPYPLIKQSNLFVLTSKFEGLPNVLLESLVLKKFIISSNCHTGPKEILLNGKGGLLFKVGDYKQLAEKIIYFSKNQKKCLKLSKNSIKGLKRFDFKKNLEKYFQLVKNI